MQLSSELQKDQTTLDAMTPLYTEREAVYTQPFSIEVMY